MSNTIYAKIHNERIGHGVRLVLQEQKNIYEDIMTSVEEYIPYTSETLLAAKGQAYEIENFSEQTFGGSLKFYLLPSSAEYYQLSREEWPSIEFIFVKEGGFVYFQRVGHTALLKKRKVISWGNKGFKYDAEHTQITINEIPDAVYDCSKNVLYFWKIEYLTKIFPGIEALYREATEQETEHFCIILLLN